MFKQINSLEDYFHEYRFSVNEPEKFWAKKAEHLFWRKKWSNTLKWDFEDYDVKWFEGGQINITENCLDRHLYTKGNETAFIWEPNNPKDQSKTLTYNELAIEVNRFANVLKNNGVKKGDRVCIYMPMILELPIAMLACARIGAIHSVIFAGFSSQAIADRVNDAEAEVIICTDGSYRGNKIIDLKTIVDKAIEQCPQVRKNIVYKHVDNEVKWHEKDVWWHEEIIKASSHCNAVVMDAEDPLFILYTSGSTGKPKGVVHVHGGYAVYLQYVFPNVFQMEDDDIWWCSADIGWITGHSFSVYAPLLLGMPSVIFEGIPTWPDASRFWQCTERHNVTKFFTAPTAIRALKSMGLEYLEGKDFSKLRVLGSAGEPINEEAWHWYHHHIGQDKCPIVDTWWQTETGCIMISPIAGITPTKPTYAGLPVPGIQLMLVDNEGNELKNYSVEGNLCVKFPWPAMTRTIWGDHDRCQQSYFSTFKGLYFTGDGCRRDEDGYYKILGRVDDVINVSGHRMGTAEIENAINEHPYVMESAVVGFPHDIKGEGICAYVVANSEQQTDTEDELAKEIISSISNSIGPIAKPDKIFFVPGLPKTRSGKIMRRILRKVASNDVSNLGDTSTLLNPEIVELIKEKCLSA